MDMHDGEKSSDLFQAQADIWNHMFSFIKSMSLKCAIQLGIADIIHNHGQPMTISQIATALSVHPNKIHGVYRLIRILVHSGFFAQQRIKEDGAYWLTPTSLLLLKDDPFSATNFVLFTLDPVLTKPWEFLSAWFQNDNLNPFVTAHGQTLWEYAGHVPRLNHLFNDAMASDTKFITRVIIEECKSVFKGVNSLVDVGGGTGMVSKAIANAFPNITCIVFDLPHVVAGLQGTENLNYIGGDMFVEIPPADAILLKWILHDWSDKESLQILKRCRASIPNRGGKVIIIDVTMENQKLDKVSTETQLFWDLEMMVMVTGRERSEKEWAKLFYDAGFSDYKISPSLGLRSLIEVYP